MLHLFPFRCESFSHPHLHSPRLLWPVPWTCPLRREKQRANKERKAPRWCPDCWLKNCKFWIKIPGWKKFSQKLPNKEISMEFSPFYELVDWIPSLQFGRDCHIAAMIMKRWTPVRFWWNIEDLRGWWFGCTSTGRSFCGSHLGSVLFFPQHHSSPNDTHPVKLKIYHKFAP